MLLRCGSGLDGMRKSIDLKVFSPKSFNRSHLLKRQVIEIHIQWMKQFIKVAFIHRVFC